MKEILKRTMTMAAVAAALLSPLANATNGYFKIGYGAKNLALAGTGMAYGQDALAPAINPATLAGMERRVDAGLELFKPKRRGAVDATGIGVPDLGAGIAAQGANSSENSRSNSYLIPSFGIAQPLSSKLTFGIAAVANGGLNTRYGNPDGVFPGSGNVYTDAFSPVVGNTAVGCSVCNALGVPTGPWGFAGFLEALGPDFTPGTGDEIPTEVLNANLDALYGNENTTPSLGVNLAQVLFTPTLAWKINDHHSLGFAPVIGYQTFRAYGLGLFQAFSNEPGKVTNKGNDDAWGLGARVGYQGTFGVFSVGASATSKIYMEEFDKYSGLFAEHGDFDIPATFGGGIAVHLTPKLTIAADVSRILYSDVKSMNNDGPTANEFFGAFLNALANPAPNPGAFLDKGLGKNNGFGFGWDDATIYKIGVSYALNSHWTVRGGYNYAEVPYDDDQALFNVLAPAVVEQHVTAGFTYSPNANNELTATYMHAFNNDLEHTYTGTGPFAGFSYTAKNKMYQNAVAVSYAYKFR
ncbi:MAG: outer membrane protein transport protein [Gammaproteobacteria bacterium]|jgi:long-chain fatty acid transport protein